MFIGTLMVGFVDAFVPAHVMQRMLQRNMSLAVGLSGVLGIVFLMCERGWAKVEGKVSISASGKPACARDQGLKGNFDPSTRRTIPLLELE